MERATKATAMLLAIVAALALAAQTAVATTSESMSEVIDLMWLMIPLIFVFSILGALMGTMTGMFAMNRRR